MNTERSLNIISFTFFWWQITHKISLSAKSNNILSWISLVDNKYHIFKSKTAFKRKISKYFMQFVNLSNDTFRYSKK